MTDPYKVLGLRPDASDAQIKEAYRKLALKYTSEDYGESPLVDIAAQKMSELDDAFDEIMSQRKTGGKTAGRRPNPGNSTSQKNSYSAQDSSDPGQWQYQDIREHLRRGDYTTAEQRLLSIAQAERGAEWNFLMGNVCRAKGWLDESRRYYQTACRQDPKNSEYASAYNQIERERATGQNTYQPYGTRTRGGSCDDECGTLCSVMCCASMCRSCCCGGR